MESFYAFIDPAAPKNQGSFAPVHVIAPEGTVVNPSYPATVGAGQISVGEPIMEACKIALAQALPERATGGFSRHACPINVGMDLDEIDPRTGSVKQYMAETFASDGSGGAMKGLRRLAGCGARVVLGELRAARHRAFRVGSAVPGDALRVHDRRGGSRGVSWGPRRLRGDGVGRQAGPPSFLMTGNCDGMVVTARGSTGEDLAKLEMWVESPNGEKRVPPDHGERARLSQRGVLFEGARRRRLGRSPGPARDEGAGGRRRRPRSVERARDVYGVAVGPRKASPWMAPPPND